MKQKLLPPKTLWALLSFALLCLTACDSDQIIAQKGTKDTKPVDQKEIKSPPIPTVALTFEELIEEFKQQGDKKTGKEKTRHANVLKALEAIKQDKAKIHEKIFLDDIYDNESVLFGALLTGASPQLLQALVEREADIHEEVGSEWYPLSLLEATAGIAPRQSIEWLAEKKIKGRYETMYELWINEKLPLKEKKELIVVLVKCKAIEIEGKGDREGDEKRNNLLGGIVSAGIIKDEQILAGFLLSIDKKLGIQNLLYMENNDGQIPYQIAKEYNYNELAELFKSEMDHNRKTIKVDGNPGRKIADILKKG